MSAPAETDMIREALSHLPAAAWATTEAAHGQLDALVSELAALRVELQAARDERDALRRGLDSAMRQLESAEAALQDARLNALVQVDRAAQTAWQEQKARAEKAEAALRDAQEALQRIAENAEAWHGPEPDMGHIRALKVIGEWARAVLVEGAASDDDLKAAGAMDGGFYSDDIGDAGASGGEGS